MSDEPLLGCSFLESAAAKQKLIKMFLKDIFSLAVLIAKVNLTNSCVYLWSWPFACVQFASALWSVLCIAVCKKARLSEVFLGHVYVCMRKIK